MCANLVVHRLEDVKLVKCTLHKVIGEQAHLTQSLKGILEPGHDSQLGSQVRLTPVSAASTGRAAEGNPQKASRGSTWGAAGAGTGGAARSSP